MENSTEMSPMTQKFADLTANIAPSASNYYRQAPQADTSVLVYGFRFPIKNGETFIDFGSVEMLASVLSELWE